MSQVGLKERSAKDKTESKQLKSVKSFIARTQAKVDAKLTQSRLLPTLSPAKRENDPFHPSLDLSPSHEEGTPSNVISDDEQPEDVAKELFPLAETTAHTVKGKGAQEPQHQIQAPAPPTNSEKVQDSVPKGTHENTEAPAPPNNSEKVQDSVPEGTHEDTEGSHPRDAEESKQQEESRDDPCGDSAMNNNAALNDNTRRINEVEPENSLLTPREEQSTPSAIPSPEGTHEKAEDGEDPTPDETDGNSGKPFFNPSLAPDGVFAKFLVKHKGEINTHDQQALWGETHVHETLGVDTNQLVLEKHHKQVIYDQVHPTIDLCASDGCTFFHDIDCSGNNAYSTIGHDNFRYLKDVLPHHPRFYIFPHPQDYYNSKYKYGNTWTEWAYAINEALQEAFDSGVVYEGSFILPEMEDNLSAETLYMNPLNPGMISLAPWVCGVDRLSDANTYNPSPNPDGSVRLNLLDSPQYPYFHLHLSTRHKHHAHIRYGDIMHPHTSLQWAKNKVDGTVQVAAVRTTLRFEVARHLLPNFTVSSPKELSKKSKRERGEYRRRRGNARDFFVLVNRLFHFENDHISVNSKNAFFPEERIQPLQSSSEHMFRFDYTIPTPLAEKLLSTILQHPLWTLGKVFCIRGSDLGKDKTFKVVPSKAYKQATPDFKQIDVWKSLLTSEAARRCGILGAIPRTQHEFYVCMNYHNTPLLPQRDSLTSMSYMLFQENNLVTYRGTTGAMISWGGYSSWRSKHPGHKVDPSASPRKMHKDAPPQPSPVKACFNPLPEPPDPELVEVHAPSSTPEVDVMFGVSLLGKIRHISLFSAPMAKVRVYRVKYAHYESTLLAEGFTVSQLVFHPECPDRTARDNLLAPANPLVSEAQDFLSRVIQAATAYGSAEQLSLARDHYLSTSKPLSLTEKVAQLHLQTGKVFDPIPEITGAFISNEFFSEEEEALVMSYSADENHQWLSEGHRTMLHFGFRYNPESKEVEPFEPTPAEFIQAIGLRAFSACAQVLPSSVLCPNMWSVARYEPGSGLRSHVDVPQLGPYVLDGSFGSGAEIVFEPRPLPGSTLFKKRQKVFLQRRSLLLFSGEARDKWKHQIPARDYDTVEKRRIPRDSRVSLVLRHTGVGTGLHTTSSEPPDPEQRETN